MRLDCNSSEICNLQFQPRSEAIGSERGGAARRHVRGATAKPSSTTPARRGQRIVARTPNSSPPATRAERERDQHPAASPDARSSGTADHHREHRAPIGAERHADADLPRALADLVRHHAVDAHPPSASASDANTPIARSRCGAGPAFRPSRSSSVRARTSAGRIRCHQCRRAQTATAPGSRRREDHRVDAAGRTLCQWQVHRASRRRSSES